jgi:aminoglycoside phosphotransferase family enzyme
LDTKEASEPTLAEKVAFLRSGETHGKASGDVVAIETHMSWVFLVGGTVFKLKKPVKFPYLDYSTLKRRETACIAEHELNRRLAPPTYLGVVPLRLSTSGLSIGGTGTIVDWLVVMQRLDDRLLLDRAIATACVERAHADRVSRLMVRFYRTARRPFLSPALHLRDWKRNLADNHKVLLDPQLKLRHGLIWRVDRVQRLFLERHGTLLAERVRAKRIVDGHGDLRPEHVWLGQPPQIIDCLEFSSRLRAVDPFDELAYLSLECERLGAAWVGDRIVRQVALGLHQPLPKQLFGFYRCYRATLRARLAIAHMLEPQPRTPEKWPALARTYLRIAETEAAKLERSFKTREGRPVRDLRAGAGWRRPRSRRSAAPRSFP